MVINKDNDGKKMELNSGEYNVGAGDDDDGGDGDNNGNDVKVWTVKR